MAPGHHMLGCTTDLQSTTHTIIFVKVASKEDFDVTLNFHKFFINLNELFNLKTNWKSE